MGLGFQFALGGLLQGVGKGINDQVAARREAALAQAKEQAAERRLVAEQAWTHGENEANRSNQFAINEADNIALGERTGQAIEGDIRKTRAAGDEARKTRGVDYTYDVALKGVENRYAVSMEELRQQGDLTKDQLHQAREFEHDNGKIAGREILADGRMQIWNGDGTKSRIVGVPGQFQTKASGGDEEEGGTLAGARAARGGEAPAAAPGEAPAGRPSAEVLRLRQQALATLGTVYTNATPETAPGLFGPDGEKIPMAEAKRLILERYR